MADVDLADVDFLFVNEGEALGLAGWASTAREALEALSARRPSQIIVMTMGGAGAMCMVGGERWEVPGADVEVVDTTGAGDTFTGYFLAGIVRGLPPGGLPEGRPGRLRDHRRTPRRGRVDPRVVRGAGSSLSPGFRRRRARRRNPRRAYLVQPGPTWRSSISSALTRPSANVTRAEKTPMLLPSRRHSKEKVSTARDR